MPRIRKSAKICQDEECETRANFGKEWGKAQFCAEHKKDGMKNVKGKRCEEDGCDKQPHFGKEGKAQYCAEHKKDGMENVKDKRCEEEGCNTLPTFGTKKGKPQYCAEHKKDGMENVKDKRCEEEGCNTIPTFGTKKGKPQFCAEHKKDGMENVKDKRCILCPTITSNKSYKGYCYRCFIYTFPDNNIVRNHKTKERYVADFLRESLPEYDMVFDKRIDGGCSGKRPDIWMDMGTHTVIVEIDENQHDTYDCSCENKRLMMLFSDNGNRPMIMIRFNPDGYITCDGKKVSSCWEITKDRGICKVKDSKKKEWDTRMNKLKEIVKMACERPSPKEIEVIHLFYDELN